MKNTWFSKLQLHGNNQKLLSWGMRNTVFVSPHHFPSSLRNIVLYPPCTKDKIILCLETNQKPLLHLLSDLRDRNFYAKGSQILCWLLIEENIVNLTARAILDICNSTRMWGNLLWCKIQISAIGRSSNHILTIKLSTSITQDYPSSDERAKIFFIYNRFYSFFWQQVSAGQLINRLSLVYSFIMG